MNGGSNNNNSNSNSNRRNDGNLRRNSLIANHAATPLRNNKSIHQSMSNIQHNKNNNNNSSSSSSSSSVNSPLRRQLSIKVGSNGNTYAFSDEWVNHIQEVFQVKKKE